MSELIHGNYVNFLMKKCRCDLCRDANRREQKRFRWHGPRYAMTDAAPAQAHIRALLDGGMALNALALTAGYASRNSVLDVLQRQRIRVTTEARILAVTPDRDRRPQRYVDALGSRRRLQALAAIGYSQRKLAALLDVDVTDIQRVQAGTQDVVRARRARAISDLYDELCMTHGGADRSVEHARRNGWAPPLAWDEGRIDDPKARPQGSGNRVIHERPTRRKAAA